MSKIKVALRVRPLSTREASDGFPVVVGVDDNSAFITDIRVPERPAADSRQRFRQFDFDHGFWLREEGDEGATQEEIYEEMGPSLERSILEGYNACLLAYGQSGTGKTHTMLGTKEDPGLIPRLCQGLWDKFTAQCGKSSESFRMEVSFMEIYREKVRDLLSPVEKPLKLREHPQLGPHVQDLTRVEVSEQLSLLDLLWEGEGRRATGSTGSNRRSSRSHAIWTLYLTSTRDGLITRNQVHLVDLAGSEKADLITTKNLLAEGKDINRSLVSLGNVISSLAERAPHIPYRDSALTWLLKDSLGGNATTAIIITASPASCCHAQTLNSLRFAQRARLVENQPKINCIKAGSGKQAGLFSGMSGFDLKKDISRLANIIRTAQTNGGILRGLLPRTGWNRLISAIENWNDADSAEPNSPNGMKRGTSVDTTTTSTSVTDLTLGVSTKQNESSSSGRSTGTCTTTQPNSPQSSSERISGTEVFIPTSTSIKCLTWKQDEVRQLPKAQSVDSEDDVFVSPPTSPPRPRINLIKYLPISFPTSHQLDTEARISEKIHGNYLCKNMTPMQLEPIEVPNPFQVSPVVRERLPTLVNPQNIPAQHSVSDVTTYFRPVIQPPVLVQCRSLENTSNYSFQIPQVSEFSKPQPIYLSSLQSTDEDEEIAAEFGSYEFDPKFRHKFRAIKSDRICQQDFRRSMEETVFFSESIASSSSYESLQIQDSRSLKPKVKVVQNCEFNFNDVADKISDLPLDTQYANAYPVLTQELQAPETTETDPNEDSWVSAAETQTPANKALDGSCGSKFRNHFVREIHQMESIGKQIQNLKKMSARYQTVQPYLQQIAELDFQDHFKPDPKLDAEIEECCGWNINLEFQRVQEEMDAINKILRKGVVPKPKSESSSLSTRESRRSSDSLSVGSRRSSNGSSSNSMNDAFNNNSSSSGNNTDHDKCQRLHPDFPSPRSAHGSRSSPNGRPSGSALWSDGSSHIGLPLHQHQHHVSVSTDDGRDHERLRTNQFPMLHSIAGNAIQQNPKWRPILPKTHRYLHSSESRTGGCLRASSGHWNLARESPSCPAVCNHEYAQHQGYTPHRFPVQPRSQTMRSLSSESSSCHDHEGFGYSSSSYLASPCHQTSQDLCSCQESDGLDSRWTETTESDFHHSSYEFYPKSPRRYHSGVSLVKNNVQIGRTLSHS